MRVLICILTACSLAGCQYRLPEPPADTSALLDGQALFGAQVPAADSVDVFKDTPALRAFVDATTGNAKHAETRLRRLVSGMIDDGLLTLDYDQNLTHTAAQTFDRRAGNCLSFSILFVALARLADLDVAFQLVDVPPTFSSSGELVLLNNHINVRVRAIRSGTRFTRDHVIDFNTAEYKGDYDTRIVPDSVAVALFHNNLAVESMVSGDSRSAFRHLKRAIELAPDIPGPWINLGVMYSRATIASHAIAAFEQALSLSPADRTALVSLARQHEKRGELAAAQAYRERARFYLQQNPYHHYALSVASYEAGDFEASLRQIDRALELKSDEHRFYLLLGLNKLALGHPADARNALRRARSVATAPALKDRYKHKLGLLEQSPSLRQSFAP